MNPPSHSRDHVGSLEGTFEVSDLRRLHTGLPFESLILSDSRIGFRIAEARHLVAFFNSQGIPDILRSGRNLLGLAGSRFVWASDELQF